VPTKRGFAVEYLEAERQVSDDLAALLEDGEDRYSDLQLYFLRRLNRLLRLRQQRAGHIRASELRMLDRGLFSAYRDCTAEGVGTEAQKLLHLLGSESTSSHSSDN
jgi:hypothetical protein